VAAVSSYEHAYDLVRAHGEAGWTGRPVPLTGDGLIYASSMVLADELAADRVPSIRAIRAQLHVGQPGRSGCETTSQQVLQGERKAPLRDQLAGRRQANGSSPVSRSPPAWSRDRSSSASSSRSSINPRIGLPSAGMTASASPRASPALAGTVTSSLIVRFMIVFSPKNRAYPAGEPITLSNSLRT
jgi:hypothetical protein